MFASKLAALAAVLALATGSQAQALTLTFAVHVTGQSEGAPAISDFEMDWQLASFSGDFTGYFGEVQGYVDTPQSASLLAYVGLDILPEVGLQPSYGGVRTYFNIGAFNVDFFQRMSGYDPATETRASYDHELFRANPPGGPPFVDRSESGLVAYLLRHGPMSWSQRVSSLTEVGPNAGTYLARNYNGLATLVRVDGEAVFPFVQPVPEPGTWALMIGGFGLTGSALRLRRRLSPV